MLRGINHQIIFEDDEDYQKYLQTLKTGKQGDGSLFAMNAGSTAVTVVGPVFLTTKPAKHGAGS